MHIIWIAIGSAAAGFFAGVYFHASFINAAKKDAAKAKQIVDNAVNAVKKDIKK